MSRGDDDFRATFGMSLFAIGAMFLIVGLPMLGAMAGIWGLLILTSHRGC